MSNVYNLQTKLSKEAEAKYRILSSKDKRKISNFSKLILEMLVEDMIVEDESTHKLHIEKLSMYNALLSKSNVSDISALIKNISETDSASTNKEVKEINQSTQKKEEVNIVRNSMFAKK